MRYPVVFSAPPSASVAREPYASKNIPPNTEKKAPKCAAEPTALVASCVRSRFFFSSGEYTGNRYSVPDDSMTNWHSVSVSHFDA